MKFVFIALLLGVNIAEALPRGQVKCPAVIGDLNTGEFKASKRNYKCYASAKYAKADGYIKAEPTSTIALNFSGNTSQNTTTFKISKATKMTFNYVGRFNFIVKLNNASDGSSEELLVNEIYSTSGTTNIYTKGTFYFEVIASGPWSLSLN